MLNVCGGRGECGLCLFSPGFVIRAVTSDYKQCGILTSLDSDEPVQPHFKLRNSK